MVVFFEKYGKIELVDFMSDIIVKTEQDMLKLGGELVSRLSTSKSRTIELVGDVGAGKTTLVRGLAQALGVREPVTSPSFTISKYYAFAPKSGLNKLIHYDFYRLVDPGLMQDDLLENLADEKALVVVEWAETVANLLPTERIIVKITTLDDEARRVEKIEFGSEEGK